jgi:hypothetical protein
MILGYIDSIEPLVARAHAQMQMKQADHFFLQYVVVVEKICVGSCFFATVVVTPLICLACSRHMYAYTFNDGKQSK